MAGSSRERGGALGELVRYARAGLRGVPSRVSGALATADPRLLVIEGYFALYLLMGFVYAALCPPGRYAYDLSLVRAIVITASSSVSLWQLHERRRLARECGLVTVALNVLLSAVDLLGLGALSEIASIVSMPVASAAAAVELAGAGFVTYGLALDEHVLGQLTVEPDRTPAHEGGHSWDEPLSARVRTWEFWRDLIMYFIVFSFIGHWAEMLFCRLIVAGVFMGDYDPTNAMLWDQWLFPFSAEGTALAMVVVLLHPVALRLQGRFGRRSPVALVLSFLANGAVCTSIDFGTGMVANRDYSLWDYRRMPFNFMGQVCLQNSIVYTVAATIVVWVAYPAMDAGLRRLPRESADGLFWSLAGVYVFLALLHFIDLGV